MESMRPSILVGIDGSEHAERALSLAVEMAVRLQASLHVVWAQEFPIVVPAPENTELAAAVLERLVDRCNEEVVRVRNECTALMDRIVDDRVDASLHIVRGMPIDSLLAAINTWKPVLVVVGSHGRGALKRMVLGSVSAQLCRRSPVPVLVVPPLEQEQRAQTTQCVPGVDSGIEEVIVSTRAMASSCLDCGHILDEDNEPRTRCVWCGRKPARWFSVPIGS